MLRSYATSVVVILAIALPIVSCDGDGGEGAEGKSGKSSAQSPTRSGYAHFQRALWTRLAQVPTTCDAGANKRKVKSVMVKRTEPLPDKQYLKAHGAATMTETGPCEGTGTHNWSVSMTFIKDGSSWKPASFGLEQKVGR